MGFLKTCDDVCYKKMEWRSKGDKWWWNEEVKEAVSRKMRIWRCIVLGRIRGGMKA